MRNPRRHENPRKAEATTNGKVFIEDGDIAGCAGETEACEEVDVTLIAQGLGGHAALFRC
jgi:hypothetical protein